MSFVSISPITALKQDEPLLASLRASISLALHQLSTQAQQVQGQEGTMDRQEAVAIWSAREILAETLREADGGSITVH